jgi:hypothetical protein
MYNTFLILGSIFIVIGLIVLRIRFSPVLHPDAKLYIHLLSIIGWQKGDIAHERKN